MQELYSWNRGVRRLSRSEIRKMKENMQKTPLIQKKSELYHRTEKEKAEQLLEHLENPMIGEIPVIEETKKEKKNILQKIKAYLFWK